MSAKCGWLGGWRKRHWSGAWHRKSMKVFSLPFLCVTTFSSISPLNFYETTNVSKYYYYCQAIKNSMAAIYLVPRETPIVNEVGTLIYFILVPRRGLEPPWVSSPGPKPDASTKFRHLGNNFTLINTLKLWKSQLINQLYPNIYYIIFNLTKCG